jgi:hypothetical protein
VERDQQSVGADARVSVEHPTHYAAIRRTGGPHCGRCLCRSELPRSPRRSEPRAGSAMRTPGLAPVGNRRSMREFYKQIMHRMPLEGFGARAGSVGVALDAGVEWGVARSVIPNSAHAGWARDLWPAPKHACGRASQFSGGKPLMLAGGSAGGHLLFELDGFALDLKRKSKHI